jgi:hypothetical protein
MVANKLLSMTGPDGALRYSILWLYNGNTLQPGWVSGLSQGQALSVFGRAYYLTHDPKWLTAGDQVRTFMLIPTSMGGTRGNLKDLDPSLYGETTFEEITCHPSCTILNGFLYGVLGLYDWWKITGDEVAHQTFEEAVSTASKILPYYEIGGFSAYDMRQVILGETPAAPLSYHAHHIVLLNAYYSIKVGPASLREVRQDPSFQLLKGQQICQVEIAVAAIVGFLLMLRSSLLDARSFLIRIALRYRSLIGEPVARQAMFPLRRREHNPWFDFTRARSMDMFAVAKEPSQLSALPGVTLVTDGEKTPMQTCRKLSEELKFPKEILRVVAILFLLANGALRFAGQIPIPARQSPGQPAATAHNKGNAVLAHTKGSAPANIFFRRVLTHSP